MFQFYVCYLGVINFRNNDGNSTMPCVSVCFYIAASFVKCSKGGHCASFPFIIFFLSTLVPPLCISLFYSSLSSSIFTWIIFCRPLTSDGYLTTKGRGLRVAVWFLCESRTLRVNRKLLTEPTKNVVFTVNSSDTFSFRIGEKSFSGLRKERWGRDALRGVPTRRYFNQMNRPFVQNCKSR